MGTGALLSAFGNLLAVQEERRAEERQRGAMYAANQRANDYWNRLAGVKGLSSYSAPLAAPRAPKQTKCPSCGSHQWLAHHGKEVCAYCRGER